MNSDRTGSGSSSAEASPSRQPQVKSSEADYLARQAAIARAAMDQTRHDITDTLKDLIDPRNWVHYHPWASLGSVTALGFLAAAAFTPTREETFKHRMQTLFPQTAPQSPAAPAAAPEAEPKHKRSMLQSIAVPLLDTAKTVLLGAITSAVQARVQQPEGIPATGDENIPTSAQPLRTA